jgi:hypothetical protein
MQSASQSLSALCDPMSFRNNLSACNSFVHNQVQVQGFRLTQHCLNTCLVFYSITATCFDRMTIFKGKYMHGN